MTMHDQPHRFFGFGNLHRKVLGFQLKFYGILAGVSSRSIVNSIHPFAGRHRDIWMNHHQPCCHFQRLILLVHPQQRDFFYAPTPVSLNSVSCLLSSLLMATGRLPLSLHVRAVRSARFSPSAWTGNRALRIHAGVICQSQKIYSSVYNSNSPRRYLSFPFSSFESS